MIKQIIGMAKLSAKVKKLRGGPQSVLPMAPGKGMGVKSSKLVTPKAKKWYVTPMQNPARTPRTGGLIRPGRLK